MTHQGHPGLISAVLGGDLSRDPDRTGYVLDFARETGAISRALSPLDRHDHGAPLDENWCQVTEDQRRLLKQRLRSTGDQQDQWPWAAFGRRSDVNH